MKVYELILLIYSLLFITWVVYGVKRCGGLFKWFEDGYEEIKLALLSVQISSIFIYLVIKLTSLNWSCFYYILLYDVW